MNNRWFKKRQYDIFVTLCRASGHRSTTTLLVSNVVLLREWSVCDWKTKVLAISPSIPSSVRFDGSRITPCKAIIALLVQEIEQDVKLQSRGTSTISKADTIFLWVEPNYFVLILFLLYFRRHRIHRDGKEYRESTLRLYGRSKYAIFKKNYTVLFINIAISEDMMIVNNSLESSISEV